VEAQQVAQWFDENDNQLFNCPKLPGNLRISPTACVARYRKANRHDFVNLERTEWCAIGLKMSLAVCRGCSIGRSHAHAKNN
jgi:hypothetical protein